MDGARRRLEIGVTALLGHGEIALRAGRGGPFLDGGERARLGRALHAAWQAAARESGGAQERSGASLHTERPVRTRLAHLGWEVVLHGRVDAYQEEVGGGGTVMELKTLLAWPPDPATARRARRQARLYAWMLQRERGAPVAAEVHWRVLGEGAPRREPLAHDPERVERRVRRALGPLLEEAAREGARAAARRATADALPFPHASLRPGQATLAAEVARAVAEGEQLLLEAPTGAGKTAPVLHAALRAALAEGRRVVVLVPTALVGKVWARTLAAMAGADTPAASPLGVRLRGKAALCLRPEPACHPLLCSAAGGTEPARAARLGARAFDGQPVLEPGRARALGEAAGVCPFELARHAAGTVPVWIADWNHAFHPRAALPELRGEAARGDVWIVDEIHHLPERLRTAGGAALSARRLREAAARLALRGAPRHERQRALLERAAAHVEEAVREAGLPDDAPDAGCEQAPPREALEALRGPVARAVGEERILEAQTGPDPESPLLDAAAALEDFLDAAAAPEALGLAERCGGDAVLRVLLPDPAALARGPLAAPHAMIGLSATLPPAHVLADLLGLAPERLAERRLPARRACDRRRLVLDPGVDTSWRRRRGSTVALARRLRALAEEVPGHTLAILPGFAWLEAVHGALPPGARPVRAQQPEEDEAARTARLAELAQGPPTLVLAVAGGVLAEGVDVAPGRLGAVAVAGPCLPPPDAEHQALERLYEERYGEGFLYAYAVPGMARVVQAAGRLLRAEGDRGVLALFGRRFLRAPYRELLPEAWLEGAPPEAFVGDAAEAARALFASPAPSHAAPGSR